MYRVYNVNQECWVNNEVYLNQNDEIFTLNKSFFGFKKLLKRDEYVYHKAIDLRDKDGKEIFEGDFLKAETSDDRIVYGLVVYAPELSSYIILCDENSEYFVLGSNVTDHVQIVGNVFDGYEDEQKQENK